MAGAVAMPPRFDPFDPAVVEDPYPTYARLRESGPTCRGGLGSWMVLRYADVAGLLNDPRLGNQRAGDSGGDQPLFGAGPAGALSQRIIAGREGPDHMALRQAMTRSLSAARSRNARPRVEALVDTLLAPALDGGQFDVVADLAFPLQALVVCDLLGLPPQDRDRIWPTAVELGRAFIPYRMPTAAAAAEADRAVVTLRDYLAGWFDERRRTAGDDLVSHLAAVLDDPGELTREDLLDNLVFLLFAGFEPTMNLLSNGFAALLTHPDQWARLAAEPARVGTAVPEFLRYDAPTQYTMRLVQQPVEIGGRNIRPGRLLLLVLGSANRDPERFADPDTLDISRDPNPHLSFGGGSHHCTGWALARVEAEAVFAKVAARCRTMEPAGPPVRLGHPNFRAHESLPVRVRPH